jgi:ABC-2 type transport system permease protein
MKSSFRWQVENMNKTLILVKDELKVTLKRKGFILTTLALPVLAILGILIYSLVGALARPSGEVEIKQVGYIDQTGVFDDFTKYDKVNLVLYTDEEGAKSDLLNGKLEEYMVIPADYLASGKITRYSMNTDLQPPTDVVQATRDFLISNLVKDKISPDIMERVKNPLAMSSIVLDKTGNVAEGQGGWGAWIIAYLFGLLLLMSIFTASGYLLQGLSEEKENRIMEVLLSSVSTRQLLMGKVIGLGAAGLLQMVFWLVSAWALLGIAATNIGGLFVGLQFPISVIIISLVYYILGYTLFAILMAGTGAIVPTVRDGQQISVIFSFLAAVPFIMMTFIIENGDHILNIILTLFPFTSPMTVMMRLNAGIPAWEFVAGITILVGSIIGSMLLVSKLFRVYLLMYGKTPGWRELVKTLRKA